ncbi:arylsulfatase [Geopyxis carbonaria]|nr:arylsulfatase [Geopyxis carbonaria]
MRASLLLGLFAALAAASPPGHSHPHSHEPPQSPSQPGPHPGHSPPPSKQPPNILFLFNDDQDLVLGSMDYLSSITTRVQPRGFTFKNHFATVALCCPSRVALLRGQHAHNTNITDVRAPGGGYDKFRWSKQDEDYLPQWLGRAGYRTEYLGKLMNQYGPQNYHFAPKGWDHFDGLLDPYTYIYNTPVWSENGARPKYYAGSHATDVLRAKATHRLATLLENPTQPWMLTVAGVAPHQQFNSTGRFPPEPCARHNKLYPGLAAPRTPNFNTPDGQHQKPSWVGELPVMNSTAVKFADDTYRARAQALHGIDEMFHELLDQLEAAGQLDNTVIVFTSDHGFHVGQHRIPAGKTLPYREDTQVPFIVAGPGVPRGATALPSNHVDLAPTLLSFAGLSTREWPEFLDGRDLAPYWGRRAAALSPRPEAITIEYWGAGVLEGGLTANTTRNSYKTVRVVGDGYGYLYSHWCTGETELYDTVADEWELSPIAVDAAPRLHSRLNALLLVTKTCAEGSCRDPWATLKGRNLKEALQSRYDAFYEALPKVKFAKCLAYQVASNEAPIYPSNVEFGREWRDQSVTDTFTKSQENKVTIADFPGVYGGTYDGFEKIEARARELTDAEIGEVETV